MISQFHSPKMVNLSRRASRCHFIHSSSIIFHQFLQSWLLETIAKFTARFFRESRHFAKILSAYNVAVENYQGNDCYRRLLRCEWQCLTFHTRGNFDPNFSTPLLSLFVLTHRSFVCRFTTFTESVQMHIFCVRLHRAVFDDSFPLLSPSVDRNFERLLVANPRLGLHRRVAVLHAGWVLDNESGTEWLVKNDRSRP